MTNGLLTIVSLEKMETAEMNPEDLIPFDVVSGNLINKSTLLGKKDKDSLRTSALHIFHLRSLFQFLIEKVIIFIKCYFHRYSRYLFLS